MSEIYMTRKKSSRKFTLQDLIKLLGIVALIAPVVSWVSHVLTMDRRLTILEESFIPGEALEKRLDYLEQCNAELMNTMNARNATKCISQKKHTTNSSRN